MNDQQNILESRYQIELTALITLPDDLPTATAIASAEAKAERIRELLGKLVAEEFDGEAQIVSTKLNLRTTPPRPRSAGKARTTKKALILELLGRPDGASAKELQDVTGWKLKTLSAQLAYLPKVGHAISRERRYGELRYRLAN
jgi:hypothetical protein